MTRVAGDRLFQGRFFVVLFARGAVVTPMSNAFSIDRQDDILPVTAIS